MPALVPFKDLMKFISEQNIGTLHNIPQARADSEIEKESEEVFQNLLPPVSGHYIDLQESLLQVADLPHKKVIFLLRDKPWMTGHAGQIRKAVRKRDSKYKSPTSWDRYLVQRNLVVSLVRKAKINYNTKTNQALSDTAISSKKWWRIVRSMYGNKCYSAIPAIPEGCLKFFSENFACALCDASFEDVKHYFLYYPSFAALREKMFTSAAQLLGNRRHCASDKKKIVWFSLDKKKIV